jgi:hypothetical protein
MSDKGENTLSETATPPKLEFPVSIQPGRTKWPDQLVKNVSTTKPTDQVLTAETNSKTLNLNEPWNMMVKLYLKRIGEQAAGYQWAHEQEMIYYQQLDRRLGLANVVLLAIEGSLISSDFLAIISKRDSFVLNVILKLFQLLIIIGVAVLTGLLGLGDYQQKIFDHKWNAVKFNEIYLDILAQLTLPADKRENDGDYLRNKTKEYSDTLTTNPSIRPSTFKRYADETKKQNIFKPITVGGFDKIEIVIDSGDQPNDDQTPESIRHNLNEKISLELDRFLNYNR